jgi:oxygen-independent coproporphyrinogen-3 oxidase
LYVHVPFCDGKCLYCGFYSGMADTAQRQVYASLPGQEWQVTAAVAGVASWGAPRTLYFGGGTPAMLGVPGLQALVDGLRAQVSLAAVAEWTVELNPASVTPALLQALRAWGVNRVSIGAQSLDDEVLRFLGRRHTAQAVIEAVAMARAAGFANMGLDLIAAVPGVSLAAWRATLAAAVALELPHLSVYALSMEAQTPLAQGVAAGHVAMPDEEAQLAALALTEELLGAAGLVRYEISNYARPGCECQHNLACWRGEDYLGLGPSASSRAGLQRWTNQADLTAYQHDLQGGRPPPREAEELDPAADAVERFVFGVRLHEGVDPVAFACRYPAARPRLNEWLATLARLAQQGVMARTAAGGWQLTAHGREVADAVVAELL